MIPNLFVRSSPPCTPDCPKRTVGCHGHCEDYEVWRQNRTQEQQEIAAASHQDTICESFTIGNVVKRKRRSGIR